MRFSGKKKGRRGFGSIAGGSTRGTPDSHAPGVPKAHIPGVPGIPGTGTPAGMKTSGQGQERQPLYGRKVAAKESSHTPLIIIGIVVVVVIACILVAGLS